MDIDLIWRQMRNVIAFMQKYEPLLEEIMNEKKSAQSASAMRRDDHSANQSVMTAGHNDQLGLELKEHRPADDHSVPKSVTLDEHAHEPVTPMASAPIDREETKPPTTVQMPSSGT